MTKVGSQAAHYIVTAKGPNGLLQRALMTASSAILLAQTLREDGYGDIVIRDPKGNLVAPENYQCEADLASRL